MNQTTKGIDEAYIGNWDDLSPDRKDNEHIRTGYRINFNTMKRILRSLFMIHNETVNIWSHLLGVLLFFILIYQTLIYKAPPAMHNSDLNSWFENKIFAREKD